MDTNSQLAHVYPAETVWDEEETIDRPRPGYARTSLPAHELLRPGTDEANSDLGNSGRDVVDYAAVGAGR